VLSGERLITVYYQQRKYKVKLNFKTALELPVITGPSPPTCANLTFKF